MKIREIVLKVMASVWLYRLVRMGLAVLFLYGGVIKLMDPKAFARIISAYDLVPELLLPVVAIGLPALETLAGLALIFDIRGSLTVVSGLLGLFLAVLGYGILQDLDVDCGCFGAEDLAKRAGLRQALYRDLLLVGFVVPFLYFSRRLQARARAGERKRTEYRNE